MSTNRVAGLMVLWVLLAPAAAMAQTTSSGGIAGSVKDSSGAVLPGVTIEAASPALIEKTRTVISDGQGQYKIVDLRPGVYSVTFTLPGFKIVRREGVELNSGFTATVNAELTVGGLEETLTVSGANPVVDTQNVRQQTVLTRDFLDNLPGAKTIDALATLTVGATSSAAGPGHDVGGNKGEIYAGVVIHGGASGDGKNMVDGMSININIGSGGGSNKQYYPSANAMQEVTMETSGMGGEAPDGGVQLNYVPKEGGNRFTSQVIVSGTNGNLQGSNLSDKLRARGVTANTEVKKIYDAGGGVGGPIKRDRVWFYASTRWWGAQEWVANSFYNATQGTPFYTPDPNRRGHTDIYDQDQTVRITWQATAKNKFTFHESVQNNCNCLLRIDSGIGAPEAMVSYPYKNMHVPQVTWSFPATSKLLFQAGISYMHDNNSPYAQPEVKPTDIAYLEQSTNFNYNATNLGAPGAAYGTDNDFSQGNGRASMSYVTGSHAFKTGMSFQRGVENRYRNFINNDVVYQLNRGVSAAVQQWATPSSTFATIRELGLYAQDQWTVQDLTLNLALRFDRINGNVPAQTRPAGQFVKEFDIAPINNVPNFNDLSPRVGVAYNLFGTGKTVVKATVGRYVVNVGTSLTTALNPSSSIVNSTTRSWNDAFYPVGDPRQGNLVPDCDLKVFTANGECGAVTNSAFGTSVVNTTYASDVLSGFGNRPYQWQTSYAVQQELRPGMAVTAAFFRNWRGNLTATDNTLVTPADYDTYCITVPVDPRLPGGGGNPLCGLLAINPSKVGQVSNQVVNSSEFGGAKQIYTGMDITFNARTPGHGQITGGLGTGRTYLLCVQPDAKGERYIDATGLNQYCEQKPPFWLPQYKVSAVYPLPLWDMSLSGTYQNLPGLSINASYVASNAEIAPSLGRNLAGASTANIAIVVPNTFFDDRLSQLDVRLTKGVRIGHARIQGMFDVYNLLNADAVGAEVAVFGASFKKPSSVIGARMLKLGAQIDF